jgi:hypothetical protein
MPALPKLTRPKTHEGLDRERLFADLPMPADGLSLRGTFSLCCLRICRSQRNVELNARG